MALHLSTKETSGVTADELAKGQKIMIQYHLGALNDNCGAKPRSRDQTGCPHAHLNSRPLLDAVQKVTLDDIKRVATNNTGRKTSDGRLVESQG